METVQTTETSDRNPPTFESVWAALQETDRVFKENAERFAQQQKETERFIKECLRETRESIQETRDSIQETRDSIQETRESIQETRDSIQETRESIQETREGIRETRESIQETRKSIREIAENQKEADRQMEISKREWDKRFGDFGRRFGEIAEYMVAPNLREKFRDLGYDFPKANPNSNLSDRINNIFLEVDILLENGDKAMLVEVKTKPSTEDVQNHIDRLEKMRRYADLRGDKRKFLGAVAGVVITEYVRNYALKQGFFVIEPSGETFSITPPKGIPKEW